jgi:hypothetical protein
MSEDRDRLGQLYEVADGPETGLLDELRIRAGLMWECRNCGVRNLREHDTCQECGEARPNPHSKNAQE